MDWQTCVSLVIVAGCVLFCVVKLYRSLTVPTSGCGSCASCPANETKDKSISLVQIDE